MNPCGRCRQVLCDLHPGIKIIVRDNEGKYDVLGSETLSPFSYIWEMH